MTQLVLVRLGRGATTSTSSIRFPDVVTYRRVLKASCRRLVSAAWSSWTLESYHLLHSLWSLTCPSVTTLTLWLLEVLLVAVQV
jgi:hypothetical protein